MPLLLTTKLDDRRSVVDDRSDIHAETPIDRLSLTAEDRVRSRHPFVTESGREVYVQLKRGTQLQGGDRLQSEDRSLVVEIVAKPEWVMAVTTTQVLDLLEAAYHLGNRHVPLEINATHLYLLPDPVLREMLHQRGLTVVEIQRPFQPQAGAYESHAQHSHGAGHHHH
jgi:urease accessory protein